MKILRTAPQILEHYYPKEWRDYYFQDELVLKAMRHYSRVKSDKAYEQGFQECLRQIKFP